jgi:DNA-binding transcriptional LysR family regulator
VRPDIERGLLIEKKVEEPKPDETLYLAWRTGEEGSALTWWKDRLRELSPIARMLAPAKEYGSQLRPAARCAQR